MILFIYKSINNFTIDFCIYIKIYKNQHFMEVTEKNYN